MYSKEIHKYILAFKHVFSVQNSREGSKYHGFGGSVRFEALDTGNLCGD
jgi:hypothetical protein